MKQNGAVNVRQHLLGKTDKNLNFYFLKQDSPVKNVNLLLLH